jgi:hypothetical protein
MWYRFMCWALGHAYRLDPGYVWTIRKLKCQRCGRVTYQVKGR